MPYVYLKGVRLYYEEAGSGEPLVLIHGASQDTLSWHDNIPHLARNHKVYAVDLPGHGKSELIERRPTTDTSEFAEYISLFLAEKDIRNAILIGHSMGGGISIATSLAAPDRVKAVVSICGGAAFRGPTGVTYQPDMLRNTEINPTDWLETIFHSVLGRTTPVERRREMAFDATRCSPYVAYSDLLTYSSWNLFESLHLLRKPIFYIVGEDDWSTTPDMARTTSEHLASIGIATEFNELKGIGHIPHWEQPEAFNASLDGVLERIKRAPEKTV
jgi:pyruvate dehydrogenase E2 component (dihydrolipoamide acetyltransferase)